MASKYFYMIVDAENGNMLLEDGKLPFYWNKKVAKERCKLFPKYCVMSMEIEFMQDCILRSKKV